MLTDLKYAWRQWVKRPGFALSVVLVLALGIGANVAEFSLTDAVLIKPLPWPQADRLVYVWNTAALLGWPLAPTSVRSYLDINEQSEVFEDSTLCSGGSFNLGNGLRPMEVGSLVVTPSLFHTFRYGPLLGRPFLESEGTLGHEKVAILTYALWQSQFGGQKDILGSNIRLNGVNYRVVGIMPKDFVAPSAGLPGLAQGQPDLLVPMAFSAADKSEADRRKWNDVMIARLKPGVSLPQAQQEMDALVRRYASTMGGNFIFRDKGGFGLIVAGYREQNVKAARPTLLLLQAAVTLVLLIACGNVTNLLLIRALARKRETGIRLALGASPWRLVRQTLAEIVPLTLAGGAGGAMLGTWAIAALRSRLAALPNGQAIVIDGRALGFALATALACGLLVSALVAVPLLRGDAAGDWDKQGNRGSVGRSAGLTRASLVIGEVALAMMLLVASGLALKSFAKLQAVPPGFVSEGVLTGQLALHSAAYKNDAAKTGLYIEVLRRIRTLPGVKSAGGVTTLPLAGVMTADYQIRNLPPRREDEPGLNAQIRIVAGDYFQAMGIPLIRGRYLSDSDTAQAEQVVVIDQFLAQRWFPGRDPIGRQIGRVYTHAGWCTIVGVVGSVKPGDLSVPITKETLYFPEAQFPWPSMSLVIKTTTDPQSLVAPVEHALHEVDPELPLFQVDTMEHRLSDSLAGHRSSTILLSGFGLTALLLASLGLYGILAYSVSQRTRELGIRIALGARARSIVSLIVGQGLRLTGIGLAIGLVASLALSGFLRSLLFGVSASDPAVFALISVFLFLVAFLACYLPARRATRVDPIVALRAE